MCQPISEVEFIVEAIDNKKYCIALDHVQDLLDLSNGVQEPWRSEVIALLEAKLEYSLPTIREKLIDLIN